MKSIIITIVRVVSGLYIFNQGYEKFTGGFKVDGLIDVIASNADSPDWYKDFFEHIVAPNVSLFNLIIPIGEMMIGITLILGIISFIGSLFGIFIMLNYIWADMIYTYPMQLLCFIILVINRDVLEQYSVRTLINKFKYKGERDA